MCVCACSAAENAVNELTIAQNGDMALNCEACSVFLQSSFALTVLAVAFTLNRVEVLHMARMFGHMGVHTALNSKATQQILCSSAALAWRPGHSACLRV